MVDLRGGKHFQRLQSSTLHPMPSRPFMMLGWYVLMRLSCCQSICSMRPWTRSQNCILALAGGFIFFVCCCCSCSCSCCCCCCCCCCCGRRRRRRRRRHFHPRKIGEGNDSTTNLTWPIKTEYTPGSTNIAAWQMDHEWRYMRVFPKIMVSPNHPICS